MRLLSHNRVSTKQLLTFDTPSQRGQGGDADRGTRDLRAELLAAEQAHFAKTKGGPSLTNGESEDNNTSEPTSVTTKRPLQLTSNTDGDDDEEDPQAKRRRILEETREIDADDSDEEDDDDDNSDDSDDDDSDDDEAELKRELERIKRERQEKKEKEERERAAAEQESRERDIARGNPLLNKSDYSIKRRWDDDVVFRNQARGVDEKGKSKEFINVCILLCGFVWVWWEMC